MTGPVRIQLSRRQGWRMPPNTVSVARPSRWGNPHRVGWCSICGADHTLAEAIAEYEAEAEDAIPVAALESLRGKNLACWCPLPADGEPDHCHAAVLLKLANTTADQPESLEIPAFLRRGDD